MNIYSLPREVEEALEWYYNCFDSETWEMTCTQEVLDEFNVKLEDLKNQSNDIIEWYLKDIANRKVRVTSINAEIERLTLQKTRESKRVDQAEHLVDRVFARVYDGKPVNIGTFTVSYRKSEAVVIEDESKIPQVYMKIPEPLLPKPDKTAIKAALKEGTTIAGVSLEVRQNLQIK